MSDLNSTPASERVHIGIFGSRNAGKSSVVNAITGQNLAIVSPIKGTTTDPVYKAMELLPLGPVEIIDTPGLDEDQGELGFKRVEKAYEVLKKTDIALVIVDAQIGVSDFDYALITQLESKSIKFIIVFNKMDLVKNFNPHLPQKYLAFSMHISALKGQNIQELKERITQLAPINSGKRLLGDLLHVNDLVIMVVPIDSAAPKGRLILPQQQTIRDTLDAGATALVVRDTELAATLGALNRRPQLIITDSQAFGKVAKIVPNFIPLTSFSILFARYKGDLPTQIKGAMVLKQIQDGDKILIAEGCTHHRQCDDIGTVKLPHWIRNFTGKNPQFFFSSGCEFPHNISDYKLIIHCGGCMLNEREMHSRLEYATNNNIPFTNYGIAIALMNGILQRTLEPFPDMQKLI